VLALPNQTDNGTRHIIHFAIYETYKIEFNNNYQVSLFHLSVATGICIRAI
jgi:hypothetical protein